MKRILTYLYMAVMALSLITLTGCSNDDIEITELGDLELHISTQNMYDQFDSTEAIKSKFLSENYAIGIFAYLYDEANNLIDEKCEFQKTFGNLSLSFNQVNTGKYTIVIIETLVDKDEGYTSDDWKIEDSEKLSTLKIVNNKRRSHLWYSVIGTTVREITVGAENRVKMDLIPTGIGTIMTSVFYNFSNSPYAQGSLASKDIPVGRFISNEYTGANRIIYEDYNGENLWSAWWTTSLEVQGLMKEVDMYLISEGPTEVCFALQTKLDDGSINQYFRDVPLGGINLDLKDGKTIYAGCFYKGLGDTLDGCEATFEDTLSDLTQWYISMVNQYGLAISNDTTRPSL